MIRLAALAWVAVMLLACTSSPPAPPASPLRAQALAAAETGGKRFSSRHFVAAARSFGNAARIFGAIDDSEAEAAALRNQAESLRHLGDLDAATAGFQRALVLDRLGKRSQGEARDLAGLARCFSARGELDRAIEKSERALGLVLRSEALYASLEVDLAVYLLARGKTTDQTRVVELLVSAAESPAAEHDPRTIAAAHLHLGRARRFYGTPELAEQPLRLALDEFRALDDPAGLARTHEELGRLLNARHQPEAAQRHLVQARRGYQFLDDQAALTNLDEFLVEEHD